ncbi:MAG TPA: ABC transporter ATP-binding protein [Bacteroidales bacterium]|nr:ABC transporter ATP-binding protein [Bacteroidales bacterium]
MIEFNNLKKVYGGKSALSVDRLTVRPNECIGLVGNNGAGKTTMLSLILDLIKATDGYVTSMGNKVNENDDWKEYTGSYLNEGFLIPFLTPMEYFEFIGSLHGMNKEDVVTFLNEASGFFSEDITVKKYIRDLSAGNKNKVGIMAAMMWKPGLLILDEPFSNLDPTSQSWLKNRLKKLNNERVTMIISSHDLNHLSEISSRILLLENGILIRDISSGEGTLRELEHYFSVS